MIVNHNDPRLRLAPKERMAVGKTRRYLKEYPMVVISGPRKVGKTTALLQIAVSEPNAIYIDCSKQNEVAELRHVYDNSDTALLLIDEIQKLKDCEDWVTFLSVKADHIPTFRVVITGSVTAFTDQLAHYKGGGRNKHIFMPIITYLEYLYLKNEIESYDVDLTNIEYGDSFYDYMRLKGLEHLNIGPVDLEYVKLTAHDIADANKNTKLSTVLLDDSEEDINRAFLLLAYRLAFDWRFASIFEEPPVGNHELQMSVTDDLINTGVFDNFSVIQAAKTTMSDEQIAKAIRYLLWHGLALYNYVISSYDDKMHPRLMTLYYGQEEAFEEGYIRSFFEKNNSIFVVNPLLYSAISDEFWLLLKDFVSDSVRAGELTELAKIFKQKLSSRPDGFIKDSSVLGVWVECYLRGALALSERIAPFVTRTYQNYQQKEIDMIGMSRKVLIESSVRRKDKTAAEVNFHLLRKGSEPCILATKKTFGIEKMNGVPVMKIPYPMLAAFLDRGEIPREEMIANAINISSE